MTTAVAPKTTSRPAAQRQPSAGGVAIDPIRVVRRHLTLLIIALVVGMGIGVGGYFVADRYFPKYTGQVQFRINPALRNHLDAAGPAGQRDEQVIRDGRTEIALLLSRDFLTRALDSREIRDQTVWARQFRDASGNFAVEDAVDDLQKTLRADMVRNANIFYLEWSAPTALDVPIVLNGIASDFIDRRQREERTRYDIITRDWTAKSEEYGMESRTIQNEIDRFVREHNITANDPRGSQLSRAVEDLLTRINSAQADLTNAESTRQQTEAKLIGALEPSDDDRRAAEEDPLIRNMMARVNELRVNLTAARERFGPEHQQIISIEQQLRAAEVEREAAIRDIIRRNLDGLLKISTLRIEQLEATLRNYEAQYRERTAQLNEFTAQLLELETMQRRRNRADEFRSRYEDAQSSAEGLRARVDAMRVERLTPATTPRQRSFPRLPQFIVGGGFGFLGLVLGLVFLRELLDQRVRAASDLAVIPGARILGVIPDLQDDPTRCERAEMVVRDRPQSVMAEAYRHAMVPLMKTMGASGHQTLLVLGGLPESGSTTVAVNLAHIDAVRGQRVLLIDANFRRPRAASVAGAKDDAPGLGDVLEGKATTEEVIQSVGERLAVISAGTPATRIIERLTTSGVDSMLAELRSRFDVIIIDAPPALVASEAMSLANKTDAVLLVVRANQEQRGLVARLLHQLAEMRGDFMGIILNRPRRTAGGYLQKNYETIAAYARNS